MVIYWSWFREEVVFFGRRQSTRNLLNPLWADVQFCPLSRGQLKSKGYWKLSIHFAAVQETIDTVSRIIVSSNLLSLYGAVAEMSEEYETLHDRPRRPGKVMGHSIVLSAIKTEVPWRLMIQHNRISFTTRWRTTWEASTTRQIE